jgi:hypothetical protein
MDKKIRFSRTFKNVLYATSAVILSALFAQIFGVYEFSYADVTLYNFWMDHLSLEHFYGVNYSLVYPYVSLFPMAIARFITFVLPNYVLAWNYVVVALFATAFIMMKNLFKEFKHLPMILFVAGTVILSGLYIYRIDSVAIALSLIAVALYKKNKTAAIVILSVAMWIKIWPIAFLIAMFFNDNEKVKFVIKAAITNITIIAIPLLMGGNISNIFGFMSSQSSRGIQLESIYAMPWLAGLGHPFFNNVINTYEVTGTGIGLGISIANIALIVALLLSTAGAFVFSLKSKDLESYILSASLIFISMIAFNKVGSAQFVGWLLIPVVLLSYINFKKHVWLIGAALATIVFTGIGCPLYYTDVAYQTPLGVTLIGLKSLFLLVTLALTAKSMVSKYKESKEPKEPKESKAVL